MLGFAPDFYAFYAMLEFAPNSISSVITYFHVFLVGDQIWNMLLGELAWIVSSGAGAAELLDR
jgi:hypothetical protein